MSVHLLDVNVLIALLWPSHLHHDPVHQWFTLRGKSGFATCPMTQCGFIRVSANPRIIPDAVSISQAQDHMKAIVEHPNHVFWTDDVNASENGRLPATLMTGHKQVTDAYLVALAFHRGGKLATLDHRIQPSLNNTPFQDVVLQIPVE